MPSTPLARSASSPYSLDQDGGRDHRRHRRLQHADVSTRPCTPSSVPRAQLSSGASAASSPGRRRSDAALAAHPAQVELQAHREQRQRRQRGTDRRQHLVDQRRPAAELPDQHAEQQGQEGGEGDDAPQHVTRARLPPGVQRGDHDGHRGQQREGAQLVGDHRQLQALLAVQRLHQRIAHEAGVAQAAHQHQRADARARPVAPAPDGRESGPRRRRTPARTRRSGTTTPAGGAASGSAPARSPAGPRKEPTSSARAPCPPVAAPGARPPRPAAGRRTAAASHPRQPPPPRNLSLNTMRGASRKRGPAPHPGDARRAASAIIGRPCRPDRPP